MSTTLTTISPQQFAGRIADLFPRGWSSDDAKQSGNVYALFLSFGQQLAVVQAQIQYALGAQRLATETFPELDDASMDFLGDQLPRAAGMSDADFAAAIIAELFQPVATRSALSNALIKLTKQTPRMLEPWSPLDTGAWGVGGPSYWDVDTIANPARWGAGPRYQGYIETTPPALSAIGPNNPIQCWNSAYWDVPGYFFGIISSVGIDTLNETINRLRAYGTTVWVKLLTQGQLTTITGVVAPTAVTAVVATPSGPTSVSLSWGLPAVGSAPFIYAVYYRPTGSIPYAAGPTLTGSTVTVTGLVSGSSYDFVVTVRNAAGSATSAPVTVLTGRIPPSPALNLTATLVQATAITLSWSAPLVGSLPISYTVQYRVFGTSAWSTLLAGPNTFAVTLIGLQPNTVYDIEIIASNL